MKTMINLSSSALLLILLLSFSSCAEEDTLLNVPKGTAYSDQDTESMELENTNSSGSNYRVFTGKSTK